MNILKKLMSYASDLLAAVIAPFSGESTLNEKLVRLAHFLVAFIVLTFLLQIALGQFGWWAGILESFLSFFSKLTGAVVDTAGNAMDSGATAIPSSPSDVPVVPVE